MTTLRFYQPPLGLDTEFFLKQDGKVIGAEKVIKDDLISSNGGKFIKDGVQCEINPLPNICRVSLGRNISRCFATFKQFAKHNNISADFSGTIIVDKKEFDSLSKDSKQFGCSPDFNAHKDCKANIKVSGESTRKRTCGGHIHIGFSGVTFNTNKLNSECVDCEMPCKKYSNEIALDSWCNAKELSIHDLKENVSEMDNEKQEKLLDLLNKKGYSNIKKDDLNEAKIKFEESAQTVRSPKELIPLMDLLVGIPSVLVDRDPKAASRRKLYGKAGDFRYQPHGIEYRTLSNFWLKSYPLMHLFTGLARTAYLIVSNDKENGTKIREQFLSLVNMKDVKTAINTNNYEMARNIFLKIEKLLCSIGNNDNDHYPFNSRNIKGFKQFVLDGYDKYFNTDPIDLWISYEGQSLVGWESFSANISTTPETIKLFETTIKE